MFFLWYDGMKVGDLLVNPSILYPSIRRRVRTSFLQNGVASATKNSVIKIFMKFCKYLNAYFEINYCINTQSYTFYFLLLVLTVKSLKSVQITLLF